MCSRRLYRMAVASCAVLLLMTGAALGADGVPELPPDQNSSGANTLPVNLKASVVELVRTHDRILAAEEALKSATHMHQRAKGAWYPSLNTQAEGGWERVDKQETSQKTSMTRDVQRLTASQTVFDFGGTSGGVAQAEGMRKEAEARLESIRQEVAIAGITAFLGLVRAREMLSYAIRSEENIKRLSGMQEALVERGVGLSYEELQVKAQLSSAQAHRVNSELALASARNNYRSVFGRDVGEDQLVTFLLPSLPKTALPDSLEAAEAKALENNPGLVELQQSIATRQGDLSARSSAMFPKLEAVAEAVRKKNDQGESGVRTEERAGMQASYNIFGGFRDIENIRASESDIKSVQKTILDRKRTVTRAVRNAWSELGTLKKTVTLYENQANITWSFLELIKKKKSMGGEVGILDILVGERDYISANSAKITAEIDTITAAYTLLYQMGQVSPGIVED